MHPMGIALAFLVFWSLVAAGTFLLLTATMRLRRVAGRKVTGGAIPHATVADSLAIGFHMLVGLLGAALVAAGLYATYVVVFAR